MCSVDIVPSLRSHLQTTSIIHHFLYRHPLHVDNMTFVQPVHYTIGIISVLRRYRTTGKSDGDVHVLPPCPISLSVSQALNFVIKGFKEGMLGAEV